MKKEIDSKTEQSSVLIRIFVCLASLVPAFVFFGNNIFVALFSWILLIFLANRFTAMKTAVFVLATVGTFIVALQVRKSNQLKKRVQAIQLEQQKKPSKWEKEYEKIKRDTAQPRKNQ
jgi:hypothetical protein